MSILQRAIKIYRQEGILTLLKNSKVWILNKISPKPTVTNGSTHHLVWLLKYIYNFFFTFKYGSGTDIMAEDWDTLILLDACRFDDFKEINYLDGELEYRISKGVDSREFIEKNFVGRELRDTVYVTANPHVELIDNDVFHDIITTPLSNWDSDLQCIHPNKVTKTAINTHNKFPNKRIIVHYMQPHDPPLGPTADALRSELQIGGPINSEKEQGKRIMELVSQGKISEDRAHKAYRETLKIVLGEVEQLIECISGKIVISADHGEMFGEQPYPLLGELYEHYRNPKTKELCKVPWFIVHSNSERRDIRSRNIYLENNSKEDSDVNIEEQLEALGYK